MNEMNKLNENESSEGWILMFDGNTTSGWRTYHGSAPPEGWKCEDGCLKCLGYGKNGGGDIVYAKDLFRDFHLKFEWRISQGGNSGVFYMAQELPDEPIWKSAFELQILDNESHPDAKLGMNKNRQAGSLYDLVPAEPQNSRPAGIWNSVEIISDKRKVMHFMNGEKILEYRIESESFNELIGRSKFGSLPEFGKYREGFIGLQDHGDEVWYRNLKIRRL